MPAEVRENENRDGQVVEEEEEEEEEGGDRLLDYDGMIALLIKRVGGRGGGRGRGRGRNETARAFRPNGLTR